jgi:hypothetical protein
MFVRFVDAVMTIPKGTLFPMCGMNLAFNRELIGPAMYFGLMGDGQPIGRYDDMWAGWCTKVSTLLIEHLSFSVCCSLSSDVHSLGFKSACSMASKFHICCSSNKRCFTNLVGYLRPHGLGSQDRIALHLA